MRIPNKIKKFSTLVDALHKNIDLTKYYITIYQGPDPFGRYIFGSTLIEVKEITANRVQVNHLTWSRNPRTTSGVILDSVYSSL